jgi:hypothetical protein
MASGSFAWGAPSPGQPGSPPMWSPYTNYMPNAFMSPFTSPYASPYTTPQNSAQALYAAAGLASPYRSPYGSPIMPAAAYASPMPPPCYFFSPGQETKEIPALVPDAAPPAGVAAVQIAPWVSASSFGNPSPSLAKWDVRSPPSTASYMGEHRTRLPLSKQAGEQATFPGNEAMLRILVDGPDMSLLTKLYPDGIAVGSADASVDALLKAVFEFFQTRMTKDEVEAVKSHTDTAWEELVQAMAARCRASTQLAEVEWNQGLRRVDVLGEKRAFAGFRVEYLEEGAWRLRLQLTNVSKD